MKDCFVITSCIGTKKNSPFKGTETRSYFSDQERLDQTIFQLRIVSQRNPNSKIFLVDASEQEFADIYSWNIPNLSYIRLQTLNPSVCETIRSYRSKSHCECLILLEFIRHFKEELKDYDFVTKLSGRYLYRHGEHDKFFIPENKNKLFFKEELVFGGIDLETFKEPTHPTEMLIDGKLYAFTTILFGFGIEKLDVLEILINACTSASLEGSKFFNVDIEYVLNHFIKKLGLMNDVVTTHWMIDGLCGVTGTHYVY